MHKLSEIFKSISEAEKAEFLPTGFKKLDKSLDGGFMLQELIVLGGHTGFGKSYLAGQIFYNIAKQGFKSAYFSLEISEKMLASRLSGAISNIKPTRISYGLLYSEEKKAKLEAQAEISAYDEFMLVSDDKYSLEEILKEIKENIPEFVIIDFIQNVMVQNVPDEYARLTKVALELQKAAKEYNCCILVLSQVSNIVAREGSKGKTTEFKGSGNIATVSDLGFVLERSDYVEGTEYQLVTLTLKKNRRVISGLEYSLKFRHPGGEIYEAED